MTEAPFTIQDLIEAERTLRDHGIRGNVTVYTADGDGRKIGSLTDIGLSQWCDVVTVTHSASDGRLPRDCTAIIARCIIGDLADRTAAAIGEVSVSELEDIIEDVPFLRRVSPQDVERIAAEAEGCAAEQRREDELWIQHLNAVSAGIREAQQ